MTETPATIVFDLDGTLVDTAPDLVTALNAVLAPEGFAPIGREQIIAYVGSGARVMIERAFAGAGRTLSSDKREALFGDFLAHYDRHLVDASRPFPETEAMLDRFAQAGWQLAVCTNKLEALSRKLLDLLGLGSRFAFVAGQDTFGVAKPDPRHLTETIRAAGGSPEHAVMVGDSRNDIEAALSAGVPVVAVSFGYSQVPAADLGATAVIDDFVDLYDTAAAIMRRLSLPA